MKWSDNIMFLMEATLILLVVVIVIIGCELHAVRRAYQHLQHDSKPHTFIRPPRIITNMIITMMIMIYRGICVQFLFDVKIENQ